MLRTALLEDHNGDAGAGSAAPQASGRFSGDLEGRGVVTFGDPNDADDMLGRTVAVGPAPAGLRAGTSLTSKPSTGELEVDQALDLCGGFGRANLQQFLVCAFAWCSYAFHAVGATYIKRADINCDDELERDMSLVCEFGLTDERRWVSDLASSAFFVGWFLGAPLFGYLSDRFGRKAVSFGALWWMNVSALLLAGAPNEWFLLACNVLLGMGVGGTGIVTFTLATEFFPQSRASDLTCWWRTGREAEGVAVLLIARRAGVVYIQADNPPRALDVAWTQVPDLLHGGARHRALLRPAGFPARRNGRHRALANYAAAVHGARHNRGPDMVRHGSTRHAVAIGQSVSREGEGGVRGEGGEQCGRFTSSVRERTRHSLDWIQTPSSDVLWVDCRVVSPSPRASSRRGCAGGAWRTSRRGGCSSRAPWRTRARRWRPSR